MPLSLLSTLSYSPAIPLSTSNNFSGCFLYLWNSSNISYSTLCQCFEMNSQKISARSFIFAFCQSISAFPCTCSIFCNLPLKTESFSSSFPTLCQPLTRPQPPTISTIAPHCLFSFSWFLKSFSFTLHYSEDSIKRATRCAGWVRSYSSQQLYFYIEKEWHARQNNSWSDNGFTKPTKIDLIFTEELWAANTSYSLDLKVFIQKHLSKQ